MSRHYKTIFIRMYAAHLLRICIAASMALVVCHSTAGAQSLNFSIHDYDSVNRDHYIYLSSQVGAISASHSGTVVFDFNVGTGAWDSDGELDYKVLREHMSSSGSGPFGNDDSPGYISNSIAERVNDTFSINAPGLSGTIGYLSAPKFAVAGKVLTQGVNTNSTLSVAGADYSAVLTLNSLDASGNSFDYNSQQANSNQSSLNSSGSSLPFDLVTPIAFIYGEPINLSILMAAMDGISSGDGDAWTASADVDMSHTGLWGGFGSVLDASRHVVTNYSAMGLSGTDWSIAGSDGTTVTPEPGTLTLLMGSSIFSVSFLLRRRLK